MKKIIEKLKQMRFKELIVAIPPELKVQFNQMQLKNNLTQNWQIIHTPIQGKNQK